MPVKKVPDPWLFVTPVLLTWFGVFMVASSSGFLAMYYWDSPTGFLWKQLLFAIVATSLLVLAPWVRYRRLAGESLIRVLLGLCLLLLILVFFFPDAGGAHRWLQIGPFRLQPSEFTKVVVVLFMAGVLARKGDRVNDLWRVPVPSLAVVGVLALLILIEPDLGSAAVVGGVAVVMLFVAGLRAKYLGAILAVAGAGAGIAVLVEPFRFRRVVDFVLMWLGLKEPSYQLQQSWIAMGTGGWTGVGLGQGQQKALFLPAAHTDFIFSIVGEELGLLGTVAILAAFLLIFWRGMRTAHRTHEPFGFYLTVGLTSMLVLEAAIHMTVCLGLSPTTGLALPFISYGGSSLLASALAVCLLISVSQDCRERAAR